MPLVVDALYTGSVLLGFQQESASVLYARR